MSLKELQSMEEKMIRTNLIEMKFTDFFNHPLENIKELITCLSKTKSLEKNSTIMSDHQIKK